MKKSKSFILLFIFSFLFLFVEKVNAYEYDIKEYAIHIKVEENNVLHVTEKINVNFNVSKHGIFRKIPLKNEVVRKDGSKTRNLVKISNIEVNAPFTLSNENGYKVVKIGDKDQTIRGEKEYTIQYTYDLGRDKTKDYDELYFNLIGTGWEDTTIKGVHFTIEMPKEFDAEKVGFSVGKYGSGGSDKVHYTLNGNTIEGSLLKTLYPNEAFTIRLELPEGYFINVNSNLDWMTFLSFLVPLLFAGISLYLWYRYGRDDLVVETVEFYPPNGLNSLDLSYIYKGNVSNNDVISLLIYLANKGYLKIEETDKDFKIMKVKEYDGTNEGERIFFDGLFKEKEEITKDDLECHFYKTINKILMKKNTSKNHDKIFEKVAGSKRKYVFLMILATFLLITIPPLWNYSYLNMEYLVFGGGFSAIGFSVMIGALFSKYLFMKIFLFLFGMVFGGITFFIFLFPLLIEDSIYLFIYLAGLIWVGVMMASFIYLPKRTPYGTEMLGRIQGFKNFLETAEKDKLEAMVLENPTYFYDILPFTYVFGISSKWIEKFESISLPEPEWYYGPSSFDILTFNHFMNHSMETISSTMSSVPVSTGSSGGFSGGGFSGGGSGGGGGGSW